MLRLLPRPLTWPNRSGSERSWPHTEIIKKNKTLKVFVNKIDLANYIAKEAKIEPINHFQEYFKPDNLSICAVVAKCFYIFISEFSSSISSATIYYYTNPNRVCDNYVLAYTIVAKNIIINYPSFYTTILLLSTIYHDQD